jgi:hypothetical protein
MGSHHNHNHNRIRRHTLDHIPCMDSQGVVQSVAAHSVADEAYEALLGIGLGSLLGIGLGSLLGIGLGSLLGIDLGSLQGIGLGCT